MIWGPWAWPGAGTARQAVRHLVVCSQSLALSYKLFAVLLGPPYYVYSYKVFTFFRYLGP